MQTRIISFDELQKQYDYYEKLVKRYIAHHPAVIIAILAQQNPKADVPLEVSTQMIIINESRETYIFPQRIIDAARHLEDGLVKIALQREPFVSFRF